MGDDVLGDAIGETRVLNVRAEIAERQHRDRHGWRATGVVLAPGCSGTQLLGQCDDFRIGIDIEVSAQAAGVLDRVLTRARPVSGGRQGAHQAPGIRP